MGTGDDMSDERIPRDFYARDGEEQAAFLSQTWCQNCMAADLGMTDPEEYAIGDRVYITGSCVQCGEPVTTELIEGDDDGYYEDEAP